MPKYRVNLFYHGSSAYDVEAADEDAALEEAKRLNNSESEEEFRERLTLDFTDSDVYEDKED
jgi:hypothetical protein